MTQSFKAEFGLRHAYMAGAMYRGISSKEMVVALGKAQLLGSLGTGGMSLSEIEQSVQYIQNELKNGQNYAINLLSNHVNPELEIQTVTQLLKQKVRIVEAAAFSHITPALVLFRLSGLEKNDGKIICHNKIIAKLSRPEVAKAFMSPAPEDIVQKLCMEGLLTSKQAELGKRVPMSHDLCIEADSGGHTDQGVSFVLLPYMQRLRDDIVNQYRYDTPIRIGLAGGLGTPHAIAAALMMNADFVVTGSINQCTPESGAHDAVKDILQTITIQDTTYAPAGDMFEAGAKVQVLRKGTLFPTRANKLYMLYRHYNGIEDIPTSIRDQLETHFFKTSMHQIWEDTIHYFNQKNRHIEIEQAEATPQYKMALIFRRYFIHSMQVTLAGNLQFKSDFQVHTGPAMGAFNQWAKTTDLSDWRNRHVAVIAEQLMAEAHHLIEKRVIQLGQRT